MSTDLAYQAVFQSVSDAILVLSQEGRAINCNPAALALFRCTREEIIGTTPNDWSPEFQPDGRRSDVAAAEIVGAVMRGEVMRFDWTNRRRDGTPVEVGVTVSLIDSADGPTLAVVSRDISSTKIAERRLAESEERFRGLFEKAPLAYQSLDMAANILEVNDAWLKLMGDVRREDVIGRSIADFLTEKSLPTLAKNFPVFQKQGHIEGPVFDLQRPDGEVRTVTINGRIGYDATGYAVRTHCILTDITERLKFEDALTKRIEALTQPLDNDPILFEQLFQMEEIQRIQDDFAAATGVASIITRTDGTPITAPSNFTSLCSGIIRKTEQGCANCYKSDAVIGRHHPEGPIVQPCLSGGLWDAGASITVGGQHIANWLIGQVRDETQTDDGMRVYARSIGANEAQFMEAFHQVPSMPRERFEKIARALFNLANQLSTSAYQNVLQARYITTQKQSEVAMRESEARFRTLFEQAAVGVAEIDTTSGRFLAINRKYCEIVGYSEAQMRQMDFAGITHPDDLAQDLAKMERLKAGHIADFEMDKRYFHSDGHIVWVKLTVSPMWAPGETPDRHIAVVQDITDKIDADAAAQESRERYRGLSEASSEAIFISEKGKCLEQNLQAEQMFGYSSTEAVGRMGTDWITPDDRDIVMKNMMAGYEEPYEVFCMRKDGSIFPGMIRGRMMHYRDRHVRVTSITDLSAIKQAEAALKDSEERWKFAIEGAGDGVWDWNIQTGDALFSRRWKEMIGFADSEIENAASEWSSRVHPEDLPKVMAALQDHMDGKTPAAKIEFRMLCKDGSWLWILGRGMVVSRDAEGKPLRLVGTNTDITERKAAADKIEHLAFYDPLTDLPNRRLLSDRLAQALTSSARHNRYGALMLLDMDDFKRLNDTMGHDVGDQFLVEVARRLQACVREGDTVARQGGDEFVVILEDLSEAALSAMQAELVAVKILKAVSEPYALNWAAQNGTSTPRTYHCTSSIGITLFRDNTVSVDELMRRADTAMYQAKAAGRNSLRFFDPEMQAAVTARAALDDDLRTAVLQNQFVLYYQPQVDGDGRRTGAEALLRWPHAQRGMVSPLEFIPLAESSGMILPLGHWVLQTACAQLSQWALQPEMAHLTLAVNVSARQLKMPNFVEEVLAIVAHHRANPQRLKLELTESLLVDDVDDVIAKMTALKDKGVGFSLDDFGTGYSSLSYLKRLPLDQLKIDRSFVRDVLTDPNDATIARTIVALAQSMGIAVIAEGVETEAQRDFLAANGCLAYQGYLFGRPVPIEEF